MRLLVLATLAVLFTEVAFAVKVPPKKTVAPKKAALTKPAKVAKTAKVASAAKTAKKKQTVAQSQPVLATSAPITAADHAHAPIFTLNCDDYADVCDNHCNAIFCHGFFNQQSDFLHFDANAGKDRPKAGSKTTADDLRRAAIGCGSTNYCSGTGKDCDEFPYASTYDGGLGCINARFPGPDKLSQKGTTRCADASENRSHGSQLGSFYRDSKLKDARPYRIAFDKSNMAKAPVCAAFMAGGKGKSACPGDTGDFRSRTTPASSRTFCPARTKKTRAAFSDLRDLEERPVGNVTVSGVAHHITDDSGNELLIPHGSAPAVGEFVWRMGPNGEGVMSTVAAVHSE